MRPELKHQRDVQAQHTMEQLVASAPHLQVHLADQPPAVEVDGLPAARNQGVRESVRGGITDSVGQTPDSGQAPQVPRRARGDQAPQFQAQRRAQLVRLPQPWPWELARTWYAAPMVAPGMLSVNLKIWSAMSRLPTRPVQVGAQ